MKLKIIKKKWRSSPPTLRWFTFWGVVLSLAVLGLIFCESGSDLFRVSALTALISSYKALFSGVVHKFFYSEEVYQMGTDLDLSASPKELHP